MTNAIVTIYTDVIKVPSIFMNFKVVCCTIWEKKVIVLCDTAGGVKNWGVYTRKSKTVLKAKGFYSHLLVTKLSK